MRIAVTIACCLLAACGRVGFDPLARPDGSVGSGPSCMGLAATCGPAGTSPCCGSTRIPGGTFYRSYDVGSDHSFPDMTNPATVSDFRLDTYEVTVGRFRAFVAAGQGTQRSPPASGVGARTLDGLGNQGGWDPSWNGQLPANKAALLTSLHCAGAYQTWSDTAGSGEAVAIDCTTWYEAFAFCAWDGGFLPTEAEWNYAAAGGSDQRAYPWSTPPSAIAIDCSDANYDATTGFCAAGSNGGVNRVGTDSPQGDGKWGQADLAGNVWEWTLDDYAASYLNPCVDCAQLTSAPTTVFRGGDFHADATSLRTGYRAKDVPLSTYMGVRCARSP